MNYQLNQKVLRFKHTTRESIGDFSPDTKDNVLKIIDSWEGTKSEEKLKELLGHDKAESLMKKITKTTTSKSTLTYDQQNQVRICSENLLPLTKPIIKSHLLLLCSPCK